MVDLNIDRNDFGIQYLLNSVSERWNVILCGEDRESIYKVMDTLVKHTDYVSENVFYEEYQKPVDFVVENSRSVSEALSNRRFETVVFRHLHGNEHILFEDIHCQVITSIPEGGNLSIFPILLDRLETIFPEKGIIRSTDISLKNLLVATVGVNDVNDIVITEVSTYS